MCKSDKPGLSFGILYRKYYIIFIFFPRSPRVLRLLRQRKTAPLRTLFLYIFYMLPSAVDSTAPEEHFQLLLRRLRVVQEELRIHGDLLPGALDVEEHRRLPVMRG